MRTKTLVLMAALSAAGALTSMAQVYSVNMVGYINLTIPATGASLGQGYYANQLNNIVNGVTDNKISTLIPVAPHATQVFLNDGAGLVANFFDAGTGHWDNPNMTLDPGHGFQVLQLNNTPAINITFVGEVQLTSATPVPPISFRSSVIPQQGYLYVPTGTQPSFVLPGNADLNFGAPTDNGETVFLLRNNGLVVYQWDGGQNNWGSSTNPGPLLNVGEGFLHLNLAAGAPTRTWSRTFSVGP